MSKSLVLEILILFPIVFMASRAMAGKWYGPLVAEIWRWCYGPGRSALERGWMIGLGAATAGLFVPIVPLVPAEDGRLSTWLALGLPAVLGVALGLRQAILGLEDAAPPRVPPSQVRDHDGLQVQIRSRPVWSAALFACMAPYLLLFAPLAVVLLWMFARGQRVGPAMEWWIGSGLYATLCAALLYRAFTRRTKVRIRRDVVELTTGMGRSALPLRGLRLSRGRAWDGTPRLELESGGQTARVGVGGHDAGEIRWLEQTLAAAALEAEPVSPVPEPPEALRRLLRSEQS